MTFLERLLAQADRLQNDPSALPLVRRLVHSPLADLAVKQTPTPSDDLALELLRAMFPRTAG